MKILITGSGGFIGRVLASKMLEIGHEVVGLTRKDGAVEDAATWAPWETNQFDHVFHLAASGTIPDSWDHIPEYLQSITVGTGRVMEFCKKSAASYTYLSSYMYGMPQYLPIDENHPVDNRNPYALAKRLSEEVCRFYSNEFGIKGTVLRPFVIFGPGQKENFLIPTLINQVLHADEIVVNDITPKKRDYLYIDDFIALAEKTLAPKEPFTILNAGMGESYTIEALIDIIQDVAGSSKPVRSRNIIRQNDYPDVIASIERAKTVLNWQPAYDMKAAITHYIKSCHG